MFAAMCSVLYSLEVLFVVRWSPVEVTSRLNAHLYPHSVPALLHTAWALAAWRGTHDAAEHLIFREKRGVTATLKALLMSAGPVQCIEGISVLGRAGACAEGQQGSRLVSAV